MYSAGEHMELALKRNKLLLLLLLLKGEKRIVVAQHCSIVENELRRNSGSVLNCMLIGFSSIYLVLVLFDFYVLNEVKHDF